MSLDAALQYIGVQLKLRTIIRSLCAELCSLHLPLCYLD